MFDQKIFLGALFWGGPPPPRQYLYSRQINGGKPAMEQSVEVLPVRERVSPMPSSLSGVHDGFGGEVLERWQSIAISWSTLFSGMDSFWIEVIVKRPRILTIGQRNCCRRALDESGRGIRFCNGSKGMINRAYRTSEVMVTETCRLELPG